MPAGQWGHVKIYDVLVVESKMDVRKLAERSEVKTNPKNRVRFFDTMPRFFCSLKNLGRLWLAWIGFKSEGASKIF